MKLTLYIHVCQCVLSLTDVMTGDKACVIPFEKEVEIAPYKSRGLLSRTIFLHNSNSMGNSFCFHRSFIEVVAMKCCTWYDNYAVVACIIKYFLAI